MNKQIKDHDRYLVAITDPHIKASVNNFVFYDGYKQESEMSDQFSGNFTQIFVKDCDDVIFYGECWPGVSAYVDYFNENAQEFWKSLYAYDTFKGTTEIYSFWNDMNEPSVFNSEEGTFPLQNRHYKKDGTQIKHRDARNAYGSMMHRTTHQGVLHRDNNERRSFVLTRSFFIGSQKYGAYWTGDNTATYGELQGSIYELLSNSMAG
jgi:alpha 1,3-glucosidase